MSKLSGPFDPCAPSETPTLSFKDALLQECEQTARSLCLQLQSLDALLWEIDQLLNDLQPPFSGKIRLWESDDDLSHRYIPVIWERPSTLKRWSRRKVGWPHLSLRAKKARAFRDNLDVVRELLVLASEIRTTRAGLYRTFTIWTTAVNERMKHAVPNGTAFRDKVNAIRSARDAGRYFTFVTGHTPERDVG